MVRRTITQMKCTLAMMGIVLAICLTGCKVPVPKKASSEEIKIARTKIAKAVEEVNSFTEKGILKADQLLENVLGNRGLPISDPRLAAKAHRVMAGVYFGADFVSASPGIGAAVRELGRNGWRKAAQELEESLRLDPKQPDLAKLREAASVLGGNEPLPVAKHAEIMGLLIMSLKDKSKKQ